MLFKKIPIKHYRKIEPAGNWGDATIHYLGTIKGTVQPFTGDGDFIKNHQMFENIRDFITLDDPLYKVDSGDLFIYRNDIARVEYSHVHDNGLIPHLAIYTSDTQEDYETVNAITN